jgi:hypothetical protein
MESGLAAVSAHTKPKPAGKRVSGAVTLVKPLLQSPERTPMFTWLREPGTREVCGKGRQVARLFFEEPRGTYQTRSALRAVLLPPEILLR